MWQRFTSRSVHKVDAKGRVSVPAAFRRVLEQDPVERGALALAPALHGEACIEGLTPSYFKDIGDAIGRMPPFSKERRQLELLFMSKASQLAVDETGRILLPTELRAHAGIGSQALFVGLGEGFQIWDPETFRAHEEAEEEIDVEAALAKIEWRPAAAGGGA